MSSAGGATGGRAGLRWSGGSELIRTGPPAGVRATPSSILARRGLRGRGGGSGDGMIGRFEASMLCVLPTRKRHDSSLMCAGRAATTTAGGGGGGGLARAGCGGGGGSVRCGASASAPALSCGAWAGTSQFGSGPDGCSNPL